MPASTLVKNAPAVDDVARPSHYVGVGGLEAREVIRDWGLGYYLGCVVKYILRAQNKGDAIKDLRKARQYVTFQREELIAKVVMVEWDQMAIVMHDVPRVAREFNLAPNLIEALQSIRAASDDETKAIVHINNLARCLGLEIVRLQAGRS